MAFSFIVAKPTEKPSVENNFTKVAFGDRSVTLYDDDSKALADTLTPNDTMFTAGSFAMVPTPGGTFPRVDAKAFANANATQDTTFMVIYGVVATKPVVNLSGASFILKTAHYRANPGKFVTNWKVCITDSALRGIINTLQESKPVLAFGTFQLTDQGPLLHANFLDYLPEVSRAFQKPGWGSPTPAKSSWGTTATATTAPATDAWGSTASSATSTPAPKEAWACATSPGAITPAWDTHKSALMPNSKDQENMQLLYALDESRKTAPSPAAAPYRASPAAPSGSSYKGKGKALPPRSPSPVTVFDDSSADEAPRNSFVLDEASEGEPSSEEDVIPVRRTAKRQRRAPKRTSL